MRRRQRIKKALEFAVKYGGIDGSHHRAWVIDQMVRALTDCPVEHMSATSSVNSDLWFALQGDSLEYSELVRRACDGEDGPCTYTWDVGIAP